MSKKTTKLKNILIGIILFLVVVLLWVVLGDLERAKTYTTVFMSWVKNKISRVSNTPGKTSANKSANKSEKQSQKTLVQMEVEKQIEAYRPKYYKLMPFKTTGNLDKDIIAWVLLKEGGLSDAKTDTASKYPAPITYWDMKSGKTSSAWHTNKGVTYRSYVDSAAKVGYVASPWDFVHLTDEMAGKIFHKVYGDAYAENSGSKLIDFVGATWAWGSGVGGEKRLIEQFVKDSGKTLAQLNSENPSQLFANLVLYRIKFYERLVAKTPAQGVNLKGWIKVQLNFYDHFKRYAV